MSSKRSKPAPGSFPSKRIKARVGKRAPKAANVTVTDFRAVSVRAANQKSICEDERKSLQELVSRLAHVSAAVRKSALVGIQNNSSHDVNGVSEFMALLIPSVSKCSCVDPEESVRDAGYKVLQTLLSQSTSSTTMTTRPFLSIVVAYVASALTSLDPPIRLQGCRVLTLVCSSMKQHDSNNNTINVSKMLLPSFGRLLQDASRMKKKETPCKKSNKKRSVEENGRCVILTCLVSLLETEQDTENSKAPQQKHAHHVFVPGAKYVTNGVFVHGRNPTRKRSISNMMGIQDMVGFQLQQESSIMEEQATTMIPSTAVAFELLERLRDLFVELQQSNATDDNSSGGGGLEPQHLQELSLLLVSIRLLWNQHCRQLVDRSSKLASLGSQVVSLLLETFPVVPPQHHSHDSSASSYYETVNAKMCCTIMDMGQTNDNGSKNHNWIQQVMDHVLVDTSTSSSKGMNSATMVDIMARLLLLKQSSSSANFALERNIRCMVLQHICDWYFSGGLKEEAAASQAGRRAVRVVIDLVAVEYNGKATNDDKDDNNDNMSFLLLLRQAVQCLPHYLQAWGVDHIDESNVVLSCLLDVTRRYNTNINSDGDNPCGSNTIECPDLIGTLRSCIGSNLFCRKRGKQKKQSGSSKMTLFERYPVHAQRRAIGVIGMLESPTSECMDGLSHICAARQLDKQVLDYIAHVMHSIRRTMSMQAYLGFVVSSIGIRTRKAPDRKGRGETTTQEIAETNDKKDPSTLSTRLSQDGIMAHDDALRRACRVLCHCGSTKVLPALEPVLSSWMNGGGESASCCSTELGLIRARAAVSVLACLAIDLRTCYDPAAGDDADSIFRSAPGLAGPATQAVCDMMPCLMSCCGNSNESEVFHRLMRPVMALMCCEPQILVGAFTESAKRIRNDNSSVSNVEGDSTEHTLRAMLEIVQSPRVADIIRDHSGVVEKSCMSIEADVSKGSLDHLGGALRTRVQLLVGHVSTTIDG